MQERLLKAIREDRAPHAILITGPEGSGKRELARRAAALYCFGEDTPKRLISDPNYWEVGDGTVKVEDIRTLLASAAMQGFNGGRRAFVFLDAQNMSVQIQNTLLKTLEEPNSDTMLILTGNEFGLLPTIRSRCLIERLGAGSIDATAQLLIQEGMDGQEAHFYSTLAEGIPARARDYASEQSRSFRTEALALLKRAVFVAAPFSETAELVTVRSAEVEPDTDGEEEPRNKKNVKKRKRGDASLAVSLLTIWQSVFRDALSNQLGAKESRNSDQCDLIEQIASRFTTARIQGIIETIAKAQQNLAGGASVFLTLDGVLADLFIKENREST
ncbi:MAG: hypothetical protein LLF75_03600 [Eubacteriales bacterium]|nr:hypothetical protein [Eubacteriales bacterium]